MNILGISAFVHDSSACLVQNGKLIANLEEERLNRIKHTRDFPILAIKYVLEKGQIGLANVDIVAYNWNPYRCLLTEILRFILLTPIGYLLLIKITGVPKTFKSVYRTFRLRRYLKQVMGEPYLGKIEWVPHHLSHASSAYFTSQFDQADILVVDGTGESTCTTVFKAQDNKITKVWDAPILKSLGILYTQFTEFIGFKVFEEGKLMALASYGKNKNMEICRNLIKLKSQGKYHLNLVNCMARMNLDKAFGKKRRPGEPLTQLHMDMAASIQERIKNTILHILSHTANSSRNKNLCLSGGLFLNCDINKSILDSKLYKNLSIAPYTSDTGGAIGAALYTAFGKGYEKYSCAAGCASPFLGPDYRNEEIEKALETLVPENYHFKKSRYRPPIVAQKLAENKIVSFFQGRTESGPRALGNRSILANPCQSNIQDILNKKVKNREWFRPFAPVTTEEGAVKFFEIDCPIPNAFRYMLMITKVRDQFQERLPGITHVDGTARVQVLRQDWTPNLFELLIEFEKCTGFPVLINTSFNKCEPIVCTPQTAINTFLNSEIDILVIHDWVVEKV